MASRKTSIGSRLRYERTQRGYSIRYVAKKVGVAPIRLSQWERDIRKPSIENLVNLAVFYCIMVDELVFDLRQDAVHTIHGSPESRHGEYYKKIKEHPP